MDLLSRLEENMMFIGGKWKGSPENKLFSVKNPANTEQVVGSYQLGNRQTAKQALEAAQAAQKTWQDTPPRQRARHLKQMNQLLLDNKEQLAKILTLENGKPLKESLGEVGAAAAHFEWFAEEGCRTYGRIIPQTNSAKRHLVIKQPIGVSATISPWNFPLVLWARKVAPALAAGCAVVARPASQTTLVAMAAMKLAETAGLPDGVLNLVTGPAGEIADEFLENPICRKISFTGSTRVGRALMEKGASYLKHLSLELGGNAPAIVFNDADLEVAVKGVLGAKFRNNGQSCIAINRIYVHEDIIEAFSERFLAEVKKLKVGSGLEPDTDLGPMIDENSMNNLLQYVQDAVSKGGKLLYGGKRLTNGGHEKGYFVSPAVITGANEDMACVCEEAFGPLAAISAFNTMEQVIEKANATEYGLAAYIYTQSTRTAFLAAEQIEAGTIGVNDDVPSTTIAPFGGFKQSGLGRECGQEGIEAFMEVKHVSIVL